VRAAFLVAPPDLEREDTSPILKRFAPVPTLQLPIPAVVVASRDDPYASSSRAEKMAVNWGATLVDGGPAGHLNTASALGSWPAGQQLLWDLLARD
jgi:predicted alpha/beta hydrolase family esterase